MLFRSHDYLMHNPDVLIEALRGAEDKLTRDADVKATNVLSDRRDEIFDDPATPVGGNPRGDVSIVEFFDYRCPYCKQVLPALQTLLSEDHKLRFVYKEMPVLGRQSVTAAHAALAAQRQGKYEAIPLWTVISHLSSRESTRVRRQPDLGEPGNWAREQHRRPSLSCYAQAVSCRCFPWGVP